MQDLKKSWKVGEGEGESEGQQGAGGQEEEESKEASEEGGGGEGEEQGGEGEGAGGEEEEVEKVEATVRLLLSSTMCALLCLFSKSNLNCAFTNFVFLFSLLQSEYSIAVLVEYNFLCFNHGFNISPRIIQT